MFTLKENPDTGTGKGELLNAGFTEAQTRVIIYLFHKAAEEEIARRLDSNGRNSNALYKELRLTGENIRDEISVLRDSTIKLFDLTTKSNNVSVLTHKLLHLERELRLLQQDVKKLSGNSTRKWHWLYCLAAVSITTAIVLFVHRL